MNIINALEYTSTSLLRKSIEQFCLAYSLNGGNGEDGLLCRWFLWMLIRSSTRCRNLLHKIWNPL